MGFSLKRRISYASNFNDQQKKENSLLIKFLFRNRQLKANV